MGSSYDEQLAKGLKLLPQMISTGLPDIMMPVVSLADLAALTPDMPALAALSDRYKVTGVHAFTLDKADETDDALCHARNFAPLYDIDEEAATGTSNGALTYYGYLNGLPLTAVAQNIDLTSHKFKDNYTLAISGQATTKYKGWENAKKVGRTTPHFGY